MGDVETLVFVAIIFALYWLMLKSVLTLGNKKR